MNILRGGNKNINQNSGINQGYTWWFSTSSQPIPTWFFYKGTNTIVPTVNSWEEQYKNNIFLWTEAYMQSYQFLYWEQMLSKKGTWKWWIHTIESQPINKSLQNILNNWGKLLNNFMLYNSPWLRYIHITHSCDWWLNMPVIFVLSLLKC